MFRYWTRKKCKYIKDWFIIW